MGFSLRKGFKLGPIRLNLSRRGVGYSVGVKGLRVGTSGGRAYVRGGRGPIRYQSSLGPTGTPTIASLAGVSDSGRPRGGGSSPGLGLLLLFIAGSCLIAATAIIAQAQERKSAWLAGAAVLVMISGGFAFVRALSAFSWKPSEEGGGDANRDESEPAPQQPDPAMAADEFPESPPAPAQEARFLATVSTWSADHFMLAAAPEGERSDEDFSMEIVGEENAQGVLEGIETRFGKAGRFPVRVDVSGDNMAVVTIAEERIGQLRQQDERKDMAAWMNAHDVSLLCEGLLYRRKNGSLQVRLALMPLSHLRAGVAFGVYAFAPELRTQGLAWQDRIAAIMLARYGLAVGDLAKGEIARRAQEIRDDLRAGTLKASFQGLVERYM